MNDKAPQNKGPNTRDHGGGLDAAIARFGGTRDSWIDLSTGINPCAYSVPDIPSRFWQALPDSASQSALITAARQFWGIPHTAGVTAASGVSAMIAVLPRLAPVGAVGISTPTYNEHAASFSNLDWTVQSTPADTNVYVHPNNPDGRLWTKDEILGNHKTLTIIDESFCDTTPEASLIQLSSKPGFVVLKGLGKFWGLAGLRLGFAVGHPETAAALEQMLGPWAISGPAQYIGEKALSDSKWANDQRVLLKSHAHRLDNMMAKAGAVSPCGTTLFRTYHVVSAQKWFEKLAGSFVLSRVFPYSDTMIRLGFPASEDQWSRLEEILE